MRPLPRGCRLVIFDVFNTLVVPERGHEHSFAEGLRACGLTPSADLFRELQARSEGVDHRARSACRDDYVTWCAETLDTVRVNGLTDNTALHLIAAIEQFHQAPMRPLDGVTELLHDLRSRAISIAVCSNWSWDLPEDLRACGLAPLIDVIVPSAAVGVRKSHPAIYRHVLAETGISAEQALFVGDTLTADVLGPEAVGIRAVHVRGLGEPSVARYQIKRITDLLDILPS